MGIYSPITITEEIEEDFKPTRLAIKELNGMKYFCKSVREDINEYTGSGVHWTRIVKKYGKENINTLWVSDWFYCPHHLQDFAIMFSEYNQIVESDNWANLMAENGLSGGTIVNNNFKTWNLIPKTESTKDKIAKSAIGNTRAQKRIEIEGILFSSINDAAKFYNKTGSAIYYWVKKGKARLY